MRKHAPLIIAFTIVPVFILSGCIKAGPRPAVRNVSGLTATAASGAVSLDWTDPAEAPDHLLVSWTPDGSAPVTVGPGAQHFEATGLDDGRNYAFTVACVTADGAESSGATVEATPRPATAIVIATAAGLAAIPDNAAGFYLLTADIDMSTRPEAWEPILRFSGTLAGGGHAIRNLTVGMPPTYQTADLGLFASITGGRVFDLALENVSIEGKGRMGALAGAMIAGTVVGCSASGTITAEYIESPKLDDYFIGGLIGNVIANNEADHSEIIGCSATVAVTYDLDDTIGSVATGGLIGRLESHSVTVKRCYATGSVAQTHQNSAGTMYAGGLIGTLGYGSGYFGTDITVIDENYAAAPVSIDAPGTPTLSVGGLVGFFKPSLSIEHSYYDSEVSGQADTDGGTPLTTVQMRSEASYVDWDFDGVWALEAGTNGGYPYLIDRPPGH